MSLISFQTEKIKTVRKRRKKEERRNWEKEIE